MTVTLKMDIHLPTKIFFACFDESPLKMMKNAFYFILKSLFVLEIFKFLSWLLGHVEKTTWLERSGYLKYIHILPNISRSKDNQTMQFGQLIEYHKRNIFFQTPCRKWGRATSCTPLFVFWKSFIWGKSKWSLA